MIAWATGEYAMGVPIPTMSPETWVIYGKMLFIQPTIMFFDLATIKISVLFFYKRIFTTDKFLITANIMIAIVAMWGIASVLCQIFEQWPVRLNWRLDVKASNFILNYPNFNMAHASLDLFLDVVVLSLPMLMIKELHLSTQKKFALAGIFALGALSTIAEAVRIWLLWQIMWGPSTDVILDGSLATKIIIWGTVEVCVSITAASLPMLGPVFFDRRGPETIVRSLRSVRSVFSSGARSNKGSAASLSSTRSLNDAESGRAWHEMQNSRSQTTVEKANNTVDDDGRIYVKKTFEATQSEK
ncbi:hypothetical protein B0O99DRAFT_85469 [Bisporella sp. PMI_857]|nr:hypothetical protein B0O99DRAFT_85469 [Bisporella sp. PMI_857]